MKQSKLPFATGVLPALLVLGSIGSLMPLPPVAAQEAQAHELDRPRRTIPAEYADLAEEYASHRVEQAVNARDRTDRQQRKRWSQMLREANNSLDSATDRLDRAQTLLEVATQDDPELPRLKAEAAARVDRAYEQAKQWAEVEEIGVAIPEGFANLVAGRFGVQLDFGGDGGQTAPFTPARGEYLPPQQEGWLASALNSDEAKGAGGTGALVLILLAMQRMRKKDAEEGDKRNEQVTERAAERAMQRQLERQSKYAGQGGTSDDTR